MKVRAKLAIAIALSCLLLHPVGWSEAAQQGADAAVARTFVLGLQRALENNDGHAVSGMVRYPIRVLASGLAIPIHDRADFDRLYRVLFGTELRCAIVNSSFSAERSAPGALPITLTTQGLSIGSNVWAEKTASGFMITRLTARSGSVAVQRSDAPERVLFRAGSSDRQLSGSLDGHDTRSYVVWVRKNQQLRLRLEGFRERDAILRVRDIHGNLLGSQESRLWTGQVPEQGAYTIDVIRRARFCAPTLIYLLTVAVR